MSADKRLRHLETMEQAGGAGGVHDVLSATHTDSTAAAVVRGDLATGQGVIPTWTRLPIGGVNTVLTSDGTDAAWQATAAVNHNLLSAVHPDTTVGAVARGDIVTGQGVGATWTRLALGGIAGSIVTRDATDVLWSTYALSGTAAQTYTFPATSTTLQGGTGASPQVAYWSATANILAGDAGMTYDAANDSLALLSTVSTKPVLSIENTTADAASAVLQFYKNRGVPADNDNLGLIDFYGNDSGVAKQRYAYMASKSLDVTAGDESGGLGFAVRMDATTRNLLELKGYNGVVNQGEIILNEDAQDIDTRIEAVGVADALQVRGSDGQITLGVLTAGYVNSSAGGVLSVTATATPAAHNVLDSTYHGDVLTGAITRGDLLYGNATPKIARLALGGANGSFLRRNATDILWSTLILPNAATTGDILYATGANTIGNRADVAVGQVLVSGGVGAAPVYSASPTLTGLTLTGLTPSTVIYSNAARAITSLANAAGYLTNNGAGALSWSATAAPTAHAILSASHTDTTPAAVVRGDLMTGQGVGATWTRLPLGGGTGSVLTRNINDIAWSTYYLVGTAAQTYTFGTTGGTIPTAAGTLTAATANAITAAGVITHAITNTSDGAANHSRILSSSAAGAITMDDYFTIDGGQFGIAANELLTVNAAGTFAFSGISGVTVEDADWIGNGAAIARLGFDSSGATDYAYFSGCYVGVGVTTPTHPLQVSFAGTTGISVISTGGSAGYYISSTVVGGINRLRYANGIGNNVFRIRDDDAGADRVNIDENGDVGIEIATMSAQLHIDQSSNSGTQPVLYLDQGDYSEQHIVLSMDGGDRDFPAIIELDVTGSPALWWDESEDAFAWTNGLITAVGLSVGAATAAPAGDIYLAGQLGRSTDTNTYIDFPAADTFNITVGGNHGISVYYNGSTINYTSSNVNGTNGSMSWIGTAIAGATVTMVTGVTNLLLASYAVLTSGGATATGTITLVPGASTLIYNVAGDQLTMAVSAPGTAYVVRTAGALTYTVNTALRWI